MCGATPRRSTQRCRRRRDYLKYLGCGKVEAWISLISAVEALALLAFPDGATCAVRFDAGSDEANLPGWD